ncbi:uncharacterized protein N7484_010652 [Penicillium longicatenatum]|uniref:uncharacterized protein n=1 Tax=Penicillium longicatenatum TaxID=1561947 RepID=UPI0025467028|nr:uncharacterized protein N7484_010652 [Penicillium longicatenatum]KAJ5630552.1 hypothetical protein N7484_010652 [Penicillium longicatenatum]
MGPSSDDVAASKPIPPELTASPEHTLQGSPERPFHSGLLKECLGLTLEFLSTSSNERLLGVFGILVIGTYIILGRLGLLLIGAALGAILHASWEGPAHCNNGILSTPKKRHELALEVSQRLLDWSLRTVTATGDEGTDSNIVAAPEDLSTSDLEYGAFRPATAASLRVLTDAVVKDYVKYWYEPILPGEAVFPGSCRRTLTHFVTTISSHLSRKRTEDTFLQFLTNSSSIIIVFLNELSAAFSAAGSSPKDAQKIVEQYLENAPDSSLANVLSKEQQRKKLNMIADDILSNYLDPKAYRCSPVRDFLREVFARVVLESTVISLSRPEFINDWIIYLLQDGESEIMHAIDAGVAGARNQSVDSSRISEDAKGALSEPSKNKALSQAESLPDQVDMATEKAMQEAKRLSAMIASQDMQGTTSKPLVQSDHDEGTPLFSVNDPVSSLPHSAINNHGNGGQVDPISPPREEAPAPPVNLHGAQVMVDDDAAEREKGVIKSRPTWDYLVQVEPTSTRSTGWMVFRKYSDFQSLHEMLETVARLNGIQGFSEQFSTLPTWKGKTRHVLSRDLERYLQEATKHESLTETERMRRFLEKESGTNEKGVTKAGYSFPSQSTFENMGKGVLGVLTNAPKGVAGSGKAVLDGVTGVFGVTGHSRKPTNTSDRQPLPHKNATGADHGPTVPADAANDHSALRTSDVEEAPSLMASPEPSSAFVEEESLRLSSSDSHHDFSSATGGQDAWAVESTLAPSESSSHVEGSQSKEVPVPIPSPLPNDMRTSSESEHISQRTCRQQKPITEDETQIAVELIFAVINELYTLSSAWNIRRTLLNAAKSYILRPGSPTLETIRTLLQDSMIESHTSDDAIGEYLKKLRENALPTEEEFKAWPPPPTEEEKEQVREKARRLFVQRGIPQALTSVMGAAASREALEKIFDSLQVESVAQGFVFSVLLQGLRVLTL